jgi:hypothetical protein
MKIIIHLYSELSSRTYDNVQRWRIMFMGGETFIYLYSKDGINRCYINVKDVRRMTIEESEEV